MITIFYRLILIVVCVIFLNLGIRAQTIKVTLLGTGAPAPVMDRFGPSILVEAGGPETNLRRRAWRTPATHAN